MASLRTRWRRRPPTVGVVVPAYDVGPWLDECLASVVAVRGLDLDVVVVDDGSTDDSGERADRWAERERSVRVLHTPNAGLGAARNAGVAVARGDYLTFVDSDDVLAPGGLEALAASLEVTGSDFAAGSLARWTSAGLEQPGWMRRLHEPLTGAGIGDRPELLGDVFGHSKLFRRDFWDRLGLTWPEGVRYEDQPTTTRAWLAGRFDVLEEVVYHWRIREDGTSITQQRASVADLADRWTTKRWALASVLEYDDPAVTSVFRGRTLAGDLWRYFLEIPGCPDEWWRLLVDGVRELWPDGAIVGSGLMPVHRLCGWLVGEDRREDAERLMRYVRETGRPLDRVGAGEHEPGKRFEGPRVVVPAEVLDTDTVDPAALALRPHEVRGGAGGGGRPDSGLPPVPPPG